MASHSKYQPVSAQDEEELREKGFAWNDGTEIIPTNTRSFIAYLSIILLSLSTNILLVLDNARLRTACRDRGKSIYSGNTFDITVPFRSFNEYWNPNISQENLDAAWDAIDTNPIAVALHEDYVRDVGLGPSTPFPWDTARSVYYIKGFHDLHCLKLIHKALTIHTSTPPPATNLTLSLPHIFHCLDNLRQDILCTADDTPMPAAIPHHIGDGQLRRCRDWKKLKQWATSPERHACHRFDDYREANDTLELFRFCPEGSPYREVMENYFEIHGHGVAYEGLEGWNG